jgi:hypothetical protein
MRYRLRTLLIVLALGPMVLAGAWLAYQEYRQQSEVVMISGFTLMGIDGKPLRLPRSTDNRP